MGNKSEVAKHIHFKRLFVFLIMLMLMATGLASCGEKQIPPYTADLSNWPTYLHDPANTSFLNIEMELPTKIVWTRKYEGDPKSDSDKISELIAYRNRLYFLAEDGYFRALLLSDGREMWRRYLQDYGVWKAPAAKDGRIICNYGQGVIVALDALKPKSEWFKLSYEGYSVTTNMITYDTSIYYGTNDGTVHSRSIKDGKENWKTNLSGLSQQASCVTNGRVFQLSHGAEVYCLDQNNGKIIWKTKAKGDPLDTPVLFASKKIYYGSVTNQGNDSIIECLDPSDGRELWSRDIPEYYTACPLASADSLVVGVNGSSQNRWKLLFIDNADGHSIGELEGDGHITSQIVASPGFLAFGTDRNEIVLIDTKQRAVKSTLAVPGNKPFSLALTRNKLLVGSEDGTVTCLGN